MPLNLPTVKRYLKIANDDTDDDAVLEGLISAVKVDVAYYCRREFDTTEGVTKYYTADGPDLCVIDDVVSLTEVAIDIDGNGTYTQVWEADDWQLEPLNGPPYYEVRIKPNGTKFFPLFRNAVKLTGDWGYAATWPTAIVEAALLEIALRFAQRESPSSIVASPELGSFIVQPALHERTRLTLRSYRRIRGGMTDGQNT